MHINYLIHLFSGDYLYVYMSIFCIGIYLIHLTEVYFIGSSIYAVPLNYYESLIQFALSYISRKSRKDISSWKNTYGMLTF